MHSLIKTAIDTAQRAQRNYDLSKIIPEDDLKTLIYASTNSPSKQNETHYSLKIFTDQKIIREIYNHTKRFSLFGKKKNDHKKIFKEINGKFWQDENKSVHNSQILSNVLFAYVDDEGPTRGGDHSLGKKLTDKKSESYIVYQRQKNFSIGISVGQLIMSAALLGYKTGICSAFKSEDIAKIINTDKEVKLLVGIGFENFNIDRRLHAETLNKEVPKEYRTGPLDEKWRFPSFEKYIKFTINNNADTS